jgi:hypothetical protein
MLLNHIRKVKLNDDKSNIILHKLTRRRNKELLKERLRIKDEKDKIYRYELRINENIEYNLILDYCHSKYGNVIQIYYYGYLKGFACKANGVLIEMTPQASST